MVRLKNGTEEPENLVKVVYMSATALLNRDPISFYELVMKSRDDNHKVFSDHQKDVLTRLGFIHRSVANIIVSGTTGDGLEMTFGSPVEP